jgi:HEAT repeat protein
MIAQPDPMPAPRPVTWTWFEPCFGRLDEKNHNAAAVAYKKLTAIAAESSGPAIRELVYYLMEALASSSARRRKRAAFALGVLGPKARAAVPALLAALKDPDYHARWSAASALNQVGWLDEPIAGLAS